MLALIDDWGNPQPGGRGSDWFGFAAVMIRDHDVDGVREWLGDICSILGHPGAQPIHFRKLNPKRKYFITKRLSHLPVRVSIEAVEIQRVSSVRLQQKGWAYRFFGREVVRTATHYAREVGEQARVVLESHPYLNEFSDYISRRLRTNSWYVRKDDPHRIDYSTLGSLDIKTARGEPLLCLADCVANSAHSAFNPDDVWDETNPSNLNLLSEVIWDGPPGTQYGGRVFGSMLDPGRHFASSRVSELLEAFRVRWT